jgi:hypothetical protein
LALVVYNANVRESSSQDTIPARLLPVELVRYGRLDLDRRFADARGAEPLPYWVQRARGHLVSSYPIAPALLAVPVYAPFLLAGAPETWAVVNFLSKLSASLFAAASVGLVYLAAQALAAGEGLGPGAALGATLVYAFGTTTWAVSSQGLWGHAPAQLALAVAVLALVTAERRPRLAGLVGVAAGVMVACRPPTVLLAAALVARAWLHVPGRARWAALAGAGAVGLALAGHNLWLFGHLEGGYADVNRTHAAFHGVPATWSADLAGGLVGLLASPSRGLLVYSPVLLLALAGLVQALARRRGDLLAWLAGGVGASVLMLSAYAVWWGGHSFGPRLLSDFLPALALLMLPVWGRLMASPPGRTTLVALALWSVAVQAVGAVFHPSPRALDWNTSPRDVDQAHERLWDWRDPQLLRLLRNGPVEPGFRPGP